MFQALFLNPLTPAQMKGKSRRGTSKGHAVRSKRLKGWQAMVKKHGGNFKAAAREWKSSRRGAGSSSRSRLSGQARRAASSSKGAKGGVPMAARKTKKKRRRNQLPPTAAWVAKWRAGMTRAGRKPKRGPKFRKISSDTAKGKKQWKRKYKSKLTSAMRKHASKARGKKRSGARKFSRSVIRGLASFNPATGYGPYRVKRTRKGKKSRAKRGPKPMTAAWKRRVARGVKRKGTRRYASAISRAGLPQKYEQRLVAAMTKSLKKAMNPVRRKRRKSKKRRNPSMRRYPIMKAADARALMRGLRPKRRKSKKSRRSSSRRRNPVADSLRAMVQKDALTKGLYITGGVAVGGVFPNLVARYIWAGEKSPITEAAIGVGGSVLAGLGVASLTKDVQNGVLVGMGGLAGVVGNILIGQLNRALGFAGLGQAAEDALQAAVESEMERAGLTGMGQFLLPGEAESLPAPGASGMGQFLTEPELQTDVAQTEGLGQGTATPDLEETGSAAFQGIDGSVF